MKLLLAGICILLCTEQWTIAQTSPKTDSLLTEAARQLDNAQESEALNTYLEILETDPDNYTALWNTSLLYAREGHRKTDKKEMRKLYQKALNYAEQALEKYPDRGHSHFVYAVANGRISDISGTRERIEKSYIVKKHIDKVLELIPDYGPAWHVLGLWHSKIANIGGAKKFAAGLFTKGLPKDANNEDAEKYIKKAIELSPDRVLFRFDLAKHYLRAGQDQKAIPVLEQVLQMEPSVMNDREHLEEARRLLKELR